MTDQAQRNRGTSESRVARLIHDQLRVMERQLDLMRASAEGRLSAGPVLAPVERLAGDLGGPPAWRVPLLPNTARYLTERDSPHPEHWNLGVLLVPATRLDPVVTNKVVAALLERFEALRLRFRRVGASWESFVESSGSSTPFSTTDLSDVVDVTAAVERRCAEVQEGLDLEHGPMMRVELFELGERGQRLLVIVHHFVMDQMSWPPFWEAFEELYRALEAGKAAILPPVETSFVEWAKALAGYADSPALEADRRFWLDLPWPRVQPLPVDHAGGTNTNDSADTVSVTLTAAETSAFLHATPGIARKADLATCALARTLAEWGGSDAVLLDMMCHGRSDELVEGLDPLATVGFLISYTPLVLTVPTSGSEDATGLVDQIDALLANRMGFDLLRYMSSDRAVRQAFGDLPRAEVLFNYHGQRDEPDEVPRSAMFSAASESIGPTHAAEGIRYYPLAVSSEISRGELFVDFVYSRNLHEHSTIEGLADSFRGRLLQDIANAAP
jgi:non-ribosomal peptide synthase protein (TIGR01720 family)